MSKAHLSTKDRDYLESVKKDLFMSERGVVNNQHSIRMLFKRYLINNAPKHTSKEIVLFLNMECPLASIREELLEEFIGQCKGGLLREQHSKPLNLYYPPQYFGCNP